MVTCPAVYLCLLDMESTVTAVLQEELMSLLGKCGNIDLPVCVFHDHVIPVALLLQSWESCSCLILNEESNNT